MSLNNPDSRRALRSVVEAIVALALVALLYWLTSLLSSVSGALEGIAHLCLAILGVNALFYGAENVTRAVKINTLIGSADIGDNTGGPGGQ